MTKVFFVKFT